MRFRDDYYFLSNMYPCPVRVDVDGVERTYACSEAAFQAAKDPSAAAGFVGIDGFEAKRRGRRVRLRRDWEAVKVQCMRDVVRAKFEQNPDLMGKLVATGDRELVEDNTWGDTFWGRCNGTGRNWLGKILMEIRDAA